MRNVNPYAGGWHAGPAAREVLCLGDSSPPCPGDEAQAEWFAGCADAGQSDRNTINLYRNALLNFSRFLQLRGLQPFSHPSRLIEPDRLSREVALYCDCVKEYRKNLKPAVSAYFRLVRSGEPRISLSGSTSSPRLATSAADEALIIRSIPGTEIYERNLRNTARALGSWLGQVSQGALTLSDPLLLHSGQLDAAAKAFLALPENSNHGCMMKSTLRHLRAGDLGIALPVRRKQNTRITPLADQRLINALTARLDEEARLPDGSLKRYKNGRTFGTNTCILLRSFSAWRQGAGLPGLTHALLHAPGTLAADVERHFTARAEPDASGRRAKPSSLSSMKGKLYRLISALQEHFTPQDLGQFLAGAAEDAGAAESFELPDSAWSGWHWDLGLSAEMSPPGLPGGDSVFGGLSSLNSAALTAGLRPHSPPGPAESGEGSQPARRRTGPPDVRRFVASGSAPPPFNPDSIGYASGQGLNCLLDSILQVWNNIRRQPDQETAQTLWLDGEIQRLRDVLSASGVDLVPAQGEIDIYGGVGAHMARTLGIRLQVIQEEYVRTGGGAAVRYITHPSLGDEQAPRIRLLHTPGHFQPLWE
jgi:hypothetical protein